MNLKRIILALTAVAMFAAFAASSASATMTASGQWSTGSPTVVLPEGTSKTVTCAVGEHEGSSVFTLTGTVGEAPVLNVKLTATGIECIGGTIFNEGGHGKDKGKLKFTGVTVDEPTGCEVENGTVETGELKTELFMDSGSTTKWFDKFSPASGTTFATVHTIGASCPDAGNKLVKGTVFGEATNATGVAATTQPLTFSKTIDETTEGTLTFAGNTAHLTGRVNNTLSPSLTFGAN
jgi:hypothetical protein